MHRRSPATFTVRSISAEMYVYGMREREEDMRIRMLRIHEQDKTKTDQTTQLEVARGSIT